MKQGLSAMAKGNGVFTPWFRARKVPALVTLRASSAQQILPISAFARLKPKPFPRRVRADPAQKHAWGRYRSWRVL
jgi:hypothetical protein